MNQNWKQFLAYLGRWMEAGLPLGDQCSQPTAAAELGLVAAQTVNTMKDKDVKLNFLLQAVMNTDQIHDPGVLNGEKV
ncbi:olfactory receptor [Cricetulus griseus]|nr:olfactory receptor [Cricetulus griseus]